MVLDYSKWEVLDDSDEERERAKVREEKEAVQRRKEAAARVDRERRNKPQVDWSKINFDDPESFKDMPEGMAQYMRAVSCGQFGASKDKAKYKLPETKDELQAKADEANALKERGNQLVDEGEYFEAAKLYEQAVLKFDWYSETFATEEERAIILPIKIPCHLNLAAMSLALGNYLHAITHCSQVLRHDANNAKALFRRGLCQMHSGHLQEAKEDLLRARELLPNDPKLAEALAKLKLKLAEYQRRSKNISSKMLEALQPEDAAADEPGRPDAEALGHDGRCAADADAEPPSEKEVGEVADECAPVAVPPAALDAEVLGASAPVAAAPAVSTLPAASWPKEPAGQACPDCPGGIGAVRHPVLGPICARCRLVLCTMTDEQ